MVVRKTGAVHIVEPVGVDLLTVDGVEEKLRRQVGIGSGLVFQRNILLGIQQFRRANNLLPSGPGVVADFRFACLRLAAKFGCLPGCFILAARSQLQSL